MEDKGTPNKNLPGPSSSGYSPVSLPQSSSKPRKHNLVGFPRVTRDIAADVHNNVQKWNELHLKGAQIVKKIVEEKGKNAENYTPELEQYTQELEAVVEEFYPCVNRFRTLAAQARAVDNVQRKHEALFSSMDSQTMADFIEMITEFYREEYAEKQTVLENIAHVKTKNEAMFFASCWTLQCHVVDMFNEHLEALLQDCGHRSMEI